MLFRLATKQLKPIIICNRLSFSWVGSNLIPIRWIPKPTYRRLGISFRVAKSRVLRWGREVRIGLWFARLRFGKAVRLQALTLSSRRWGNRAEVLRGLTIKHAWGRRSQDSTPSTSLPRRLVPLESQEILGRPRWGSEALWDRDSSVSMEQLSDLRGWCWIQDKSLR